MYWKRIIMRGISDIYSLTGSIIGMPCGYRILMYHSVGGNVIRDKLNIFGITPELFNQHMEYLSKQSILPVTEFSVDALVSQQNSIAITFDDGYKDNLYTAAPILEKFKFPYTVFVSTEFVKSGDKNFLSPEELRELSELPNAQIGSHGVSHTALAECSDQELKNELVYSKHYIEDIIGKEITTVGYPHGSVDQRVRSEAEEAGYKLGGTSYMDINRKGSDQLQLARTSVLGIDTLRVFKQKVHGGWDWYRLLQDNPAVY